MSIAFAGPSNRTFKSINSRKPACVGNGVVTRSTHGPLTAKKIYNSIYTKEIFATKRKISEEEEEEEDHLEELFEDEIKEEKHILETSKRHKERENPVEAVKRNAAMFSRQIKDAQSKKGVPIIEDYKVTKPEEESHPDLPHILTCWIEHMIEDENARHRYFAHADTPQEFYKKNAHKMVPVLGFIGFIKELLE